MQMKMKVISSILNTCLCKKLSTLAVIALCCVSVFGQKQKALTGKWLGTLTQTPTVTSPVFYFELYLEEKDGQLQETLDKTADFVETSLRGELRQSLRGNSLFHRR